MLIFFLSILLLLKASSTEIIGLDTLPLIILGATVSNLGGDDSAGGFPLYDSTFSIAKSKFY